jgi:hypothetical protein
MKEAPEVEASAMLEEVATNDAAMSEIHVVVVIAAGSVVEIVSLRAIEPAVLAVLIPGALIVERAALRSLAVTAELAARAVEARMTGWPT